MDVKTTSEDGFCDGQPVVQAGIQAFGILFVLGLDREILQVSVNVETTLGMPCAQLIGTDFAALVRNRLSTLSLDMKRFRTLSEMCDATTVELKSILAVDKVMVYRFDDSWHGTVVSEAKEAEMETYLDLRFPATDIPAPARRLYAHNPTRMIPDRDRAYGERAGGRLDHGAI